MREQRGSSTWPSLVVGAVGEIVLGGVNKELGTVEDVGGSIHLKRNKTRLLASVKETNAKLQLKLLFVSRVKMLSATNSISVL